MRSAKTWVLLAAPLFGALPALAETPPASSSPATQPTPELAPAPQQQPAAQEPVKSAESPTVTTTVPAVPTAPNPAAEETFTTITAPIGEAPPLPYPVVLSLGSHLTPRLGVGDFYIEPHARVRLRAAWTQEDPNDFTIGRNNGFNLDQARIGVTGGFRRTVRFALSLEGAHVSRTSNNLLTGELSTRLRDAYFTFSPWEFLQFTAGQFIPPTDREALSGFDAAAGSNRGGVATPQLLPQLSVANRGTVPGEGRPTSGFYRGRELGVMMHGNVNPLPFLGGTYALALVNGNGENRILNDNSDPFIHGRVTAGLHNLPILTLLNVGASLRYGRNTDITNIPDTVSDQVLGGAFDSVIQLIGFQVWGQVMWQQTRHLTTGIPSELSLGGFLQVAYRDLFGFSPVFRAAYYQFSNAFPLNVAELTGGMRYDMPGLPITLQLAFTHPEETGWGVYDIGRTGLKNERLTNIPRAPGAIRSPFGIPDWGLDTRDTTTLLNDRAEFIAQMSF